MDQSHGLGNWTERNEDLFQSQFPVHRACRDGDIDCLVSLLSAGDVDFYEEDHFYGWTPVHWASYFGKLDCLRRLVSFESGGVGCDIASSKFSQTPLHLCSYAGHSRCLQWLLQSNCSFNSQDYMGETPCHKAARTGSMECISLLVSQGAKLHMRNHSGNTPSQVAASSGFSECANYLERAMQIQLQATDVYHELRTPVTHPNTSMVNPLSNPIVSDKSSPQNVCQSVSGGNALISVNRYHSNPHFISNGTALGSDNPGIVNGLIHNNNNQSEDCDMEMEAECEEGGGACHISNGAMEEDPNKNLQLGQGVLRNGVQLAGKKRGLEVGEEENFKRARSEEPSMSKSKLNGWLQNNGHMASHMTSHLTPITESMVEHYKSVSVQQGYDNMVLDSVMNNCHGS